MVWLYSQFESTYFRMIIMVGHAYHTSKSNEHIKIVYSRVCVLLAMVPRADQGGTVLIVILSKILSIEAVATHNWKSGSLRYCKYQQNFDFFTTSVPFYRCEIHRTVARLNVHNVGFLSSALGNLCVWPRDTTQRPAPIVTHAENRCTIFSSHLLPFIVTVRFS